eukprot:Pgem_evm1s18194
MRSLSCNLENFHKKAINSRSYANDEIDNDVNLVSVNDIDVVTDAQIAKRPTSMLHRPRSNRNFLSGI